MKGFSWITRILVIVGAINWGLVGVVDFNLVESIFGSSTFTDIIYLLVGIAGIFELIALFRK